MTSVNVDTNQTDKLLRLLDTVVIKLEGGTDEDLKVLDENPTIEQRPEPIRELFSTAPAAASAVAAAPHTSKTNDLTATNEPKSEDCTINDNDDDSNDIKEVEPTTKLDETPADEKPINVDEKSSKKRKRTTSGSSSSSSSSTSSSGNFYLALYSLRSLTYIFYKKKKHQ